MKINYCIIKGDDKGFPMEFNEDLLREFRDNVVGFSHDDMTHFESMLTVDWGRTREDNEKGGIRIWFRKDGYIKYNECNFLMFTKKSPADCPETLSEWIEQTNEILV